MGEDILKHDWYHVLGCKLDDTKEQLNKASRKLSLKYHPDKNPEKSAEAMFLLIQKAKEVLLDDTSRLEYDTAFKKVMKRKQYDEQRKGTMDANKKRMRDELEKKMQNAKGHNRDTDRDESSAKAKKSRADEIKHLQEQNMQRMESHHKEAMEREAAIRDQVTDAILRHNKESADSTSSSVRLKVKWRKNDYSQSENLILQEFRSYGHIEYIDFGGSKGNSAVITFSSSRSVQSAIEAMDESTIYKVSRVVDSGQNDVFNHIYGSTKSAHVKNDSNNSTNTSNMMDHIRRAVGREEMLKTPASNDASKLPSDGQTRAAFSFNASAPSIFKKTAGSAADLKGKEDDILKKMLQASQAKNKYDSVITK